MKDGGVINFIVWVNIDLGDYQYGLAMPRELLESDSGGER